jgi:carboxyl-terminal processing protease
MRFAVPLLIAAALTAADHGGHAPAADPHAGHAAPAADPHAGHAAPAADPHASHAAPAADPHARPAAAAAPRAAHEPAATPGVAPDTSERGSELRRLAARLADLDRLLQLVRREHADDPAEDALWAAARRGMLGSLDPASTYLTRDEVALYAAGEEPQRHGFGFDWRRDGDALRIGRIVPDSPAAKAQLRRGDRITGAGGRTSTKDGIEAVIAALRAGGDQVQLLAGRAGAPPVTVELARADLADRGLGAVSTLDARGIAVIEVQRFFAGRNDPATGERIAPSTAEALTAAVRGLGPGLRALVLDLRGNGGGNLQTAIDVADRFLGAGGAGETIVRQESRLPERTRTVTARGGDDLPPMPLAVIIDSDSASSAEVLAAALQDHRRAVLVGGQSRGKGTVQQLFLLPEGDAALLTVARLVRSNGAPLDAGVTPDVAAGEDAVARARDIVAALIARGR